MKAQVLKFKARSQSSASDSDIHSQLVQWIDDADDYFSDANERSIRDRNYYDGRQWADEDAQDRIDSDRAVITMNRIARKIRFLKGYESRNRTSPKALPRTPTHENAADTATEGLRYVADYCHIDQKFSDAYEFLMIEGIEAVEVVAKQQQQGVDPHINLIPWDRLVYDPYSREKDFSDSRYLGIVTWMDQDEALAMWPDAADTIDQAFSGSSASSGIYEDRPSWSISTITGRERVRFVQLYFRQEGQWLHAILTHSGFLEEPKPSIWVDEYGKPECPIIAGASFVNIDNERYGIVREMIDPQDEINVRHSNAIDFLVTRQSVGEKGAVANVNEAKLELAKPKGHVEITPGMRFDILPSDDLSKGNLEALTLARQEIDTMGPNASMLGKDTKAPSGRAVIAQQEGGLYEIGPLQDCHRDLKLRTYRAVWHRIKQFWKAEKWVRITDDENKPKFIGLNVPITYGQMIAQQNGGQIPPQAQMQYGPLLNQPAQVQNDISYLDVDIVLDEVPHSAILQQEQFDSLVDLVKLAAGMGQRVPFKALLQASSLRDKEKLSKMMDEQDQQAQQGQAQHNELLAKQLAAEIEKSLASARQADADALLKTITAQLQGLQAGTYGMLAPPLQPPPGAMPQPMPMQGQPMQGPPGMMPPGPPPMGQLPPSGGQMPPPGMMQGAVAP